MKQVLVAMIAISLLLSACGAGKEAGTSSTPMPTETKIPTATNTPAPTSTVTPTNTVTPTSTPTLIYPLGEATPLPANLDGIRPENVGRVIQLMHLGRGVFYDVDWSSQNEVAFASTLGVFVYNPVTFEEIDYIPCTDATVQQVAYSPDGSLLAYGTRDGQIHVRDVVKNEEITSIRASDQYFKIFEFHPNGKILIYEQLGDAKIYFLQIPTGSLAAEYTARNDPNALAFSPDGNTLILGGLGEEGIVRRTENVLPGLTILELNHIINDKGNIAFHPDGKTLIVGTYTRGIHLLRLSDGAYIQTIGKNLSFTAMALSPDGQTLAVYKRQNGVDLWRVSDWSLLRTLHGSGVIVPYEAAMAGFGSLAFSPDGKKIAFGLDASRTHAPIMILWNVEDGKILYELKNDFSPFPMMFSPDGQLIAMGQDGTIQLWDVKEWKLVRTIQHTTYLYNAVFSPDGQLIASLGRKDQEQSALIWRVADGTLVNELASGYGDLRSLSFSPDGKTIAVGRKASTWLWNVSDGSQVTSLLGTGGVFSPDGQLLATYDESRVHIWQISTGMEKFSFCEGKVDSIAFSQDGSHFMCGFASDRRLWKSTIVKFTNNGFEEISSHGAIASVFSPDGRLVITTTDPGTLLFYETSTGKLLGELKQNYWLFSRILASPDGKLVATYTELDWTVRIYGVRP